MLLTLALALVCGSTLPNTDGNISERVAKKELYQTAAAMTAIKAEYSLQKESVAGYEAKVKLKQARRDFKSAVAKLDGTMPKEKTVKKELYKKAAEITTLKREFSLVKEAGSFKNNSSDTKDLPGYSIKQALKKARSEFKTLIGLKA